MLTLDYKQDETHQILSTHLESVSKSISQQIIRTSGELIACDLMTIENTNIIIALSRGLVGAKAETICFSGNRTHSGSFNER